jgi:ABC-2 type transport system permease protein
VSRYWRIYRTFVSSSLARELEFRANFFAKVGENAVWIGFFVMVLLVIYGNTDDVAGWGRGEAFILTATIFMMNALSSALFFSLQEIPQQVRLGTLDFVVTKPVDSQFWVSVRKFNFSHIGTFVGGLVLLGIGLYQAGLRPDLLQSVAYAILVLASLALFYAFNLALMTTGIWLIRVDNLWVLGESVLQVSRYPVDIYPGALQRLFVWVVPLAFLATIPARQLVVGLDPAMLALGVLWASVALLVSRLFWRFALRHYTSASS